MKRLAASAVVAARTAGFDDDVAGRAARAAASYRTHMAGYARERVLDVWCEVVDVDEAEATVRPERPATLEPRADKARRQTSLSVLPKLAEITGEGPRLRDHPPLVQRLGDPAVIEVVTDLVERHRASVADELHRLVDRFTLLDPALKVVGVGSVGTGASSPCSTPRRRRRPLFLQVKEAQPSVLEAHLPASSYPSPGDRVVRGQRMVQATSDILLGWFDAFGHSYDVRQLRDMKASVDLTVIAPEPFVRYCGLCGWVLARAHARTGDPVALTGHLGSGTVCDEAIAAFATDYATVAEADHARQVAAVAAGDIEVVDA